MAETTSPASRLAQMKIPFEIDKGFDIEALKCLTNEDINILIPEEKLALRCIFRRKYFQWKSEQGYTTPLAETLSISSIKTWLDTSLSGEEIANEIVHDGPSKVKVDSLFSPVTSNNFDLKQILEKSLIGKDLLQKKVLNKTDRNRLTQIICENWLNQNYFPTQTDHHKITTEITKIFEKENKNLYIGDSTVRGILVQKYYTLNKKYQLSGLVKSRYNLKKTTAEGSKKFCLEDTGNLCQEVDEQILNDIEWLKFNNKPDDLVIAKWKNTFHVRQQDAKKNIDLFLNWPILKQRIGSQLIELDFETKYPSKSAILYSKWENFKIKIHSIYKNVKKDKGSKQILLELQNENLNSESRNYFYVILLCSVLVPTIIKTNSTVWKPTIADGQHGLAVFVNMRFQQKQQMEREQRRVEMTSTKMAVEETTTTTQTTSKSSSSKKALNSSIVPGKVRQMFDERRRGTGIDKSYPLKPLSNNNLNNNNSMYNQRSTSGSSSGGSSSGANSGLISKKTTSITTNSINRNGNIVTNRTQSTVTSTKPLRAQQQHPVTTINSTISGNLKKTPLNGRSVNASSIQGNAQRIITKTTTTTQHNNNSIDYDNDNDDIDYNDNHNINDNDNNNNYEDDNDIDDDDYLDNDNNENFTVMNEDLMNENPNNLDEENFPDEMNVGKNALKKKLPNVGKLSLDDRNNNAGGDMKSSSNIKLKPVITRKTLPSSPANTNRQKINPVKNTPPPKSTGSRSQSNITQKPVKTMTKNNTKMLSTKVEVIKPTEKVSLGPPPEGMAACSICGRHFNVDRIEKHESICQRAATKKRKIFDSTKHRVKGTEAEVYLKRVAKNPGRSDARSTPSSTSITPSTKQPSKSIGNASQDKKSNWRKKHEEFINAIRAAKEVQKHLAKGGKLSDLPPPPPSENPDYIQCPHCSRRFNEGAASRHIPKCADMLHNKPKNKSPPKKKF